MNVNEFGFISMDNNTLSTSGRMVGITQENAQENFGTIGEFTDPTNAGHTYSINNNIYMLALLGSFEHWETIETLSTTYENKDDFVEINCPYNCENDDSMET